VLSSIELVSSRKVRKVVWKEVKESASKETVKMRKRVRHHEQMKIEDLRE
jgi:hypothetical protein